MNNNSYFYPKLTAVNRDQVYKNFRNFIFIFLCLFVLGFAQGQEGQKKIDSLKLKLEHARSNSQKVDILNKMANNLRYNQVEEGLGYAQKALKLAQENTYEAGAAKALYNIGVLYYYKGDYKLALHYYNQSKNRYHQLKNSAESANVTSAIGSIYFSLGQYGKALEVYNEALKQYEASSNLIGVAQVKDNIGTLHFYQKDYKKSLKYNLESIATFQKANYTHNVFYSTALTNLGMYYFENGDLQNAERYYLQSLVINKEIANQFLLAKNYCSLGDIYFKLHKIQQAEEFHLTALQIGENIGNQEVIGYSLGDLGKTFLLKGQNESQEILKKESFQKSINFLEKSIAIFKKTKNIQAYQEYAKELSDAYNEVGAYKKALQSFRQHTYYKDSLFNEDTRKEFTRKEVGFEFAKREDSIKMVNEKKNAVKDATLQENRKKKWLYIFSIFLLVIIGGMLIFQNRSQKKNNQKLSKLNSDLEEANEIKNRFFNILNHDLRAPISNVIKLLKLSQNHDFAIDDVTKTRLESQTINVAENLLLTMEDLLFWSKGQMQYFKLDFNKVLLHQLLTDLLQHYQIEGKENVWIDIPQNLSIYTDENYLKTIIRNLTSNAIKATAKVEKPQIHWIASVTQDAVVLTISDNGGGAHLSDFSALYDHENETSISSGLGLHLVREMVLAIQCTIKVNTTLNKGTQITLEFLNTNSLNL